MRTLVTGFGSFGAVNDNPSGRLAQASGQPSIVLEVAFAVVDEFISSLDPASFDVLLMLGVAVSRDKITPELYARNYIGEGPDVRGETRFGDIEPGQPLLVESTLWNPHLLADLEWQDDLHTSLDAGDYLCNYLSYRALRRFPEKRVGFLHVPPFERISEARQSQILADVLRAIEA